MTAEPDDGATGDPDDGATVDPDDSGTGDPDDSGTGDPDDGADPAAHLREDDIAPGYVRPAYGEYCFSAVPATAAAVLGADPPALDLGQPLPEDVLAGVDGGSGDSRGGADTGTSTDTGDISTVVVLLVDGLGWEQFHRDAGEHALLSRLADRATLTPLTGIYPTETAACVTTMHTGALPAEHAVLGWDVYLPDHDAYVETLPYRLFPDGPSLEQALGPDFDVGDLVRADPIYPRLADAGIASTAIQPASTQGPYASYTLTGADSRWYEGVEGLAREIRRTCEAASADETPRYVYAYAPDVDAAAHYAGTESTAYRRALADLCGAIEFELLADIDPGVAEETLILVTADHGEVDTDPARNVDLWDRPGLCDRLVRRPDGTPIPPVGGPRNVHLHVRDGEREALKRDLEADLDALVLSREEYLRAGLFGPGEPREPFRERAGDLLVIPNERSVWFDGAPALEFVGMHGGLHPREAIVPLAACRLADLVP